MRHRNDTEAAMTVATDPPQTVDVDEVVDLPDHIAGLTCLDEPCPPLATGGIVTYSGLALVGEHGPEQIPGDLQPRIGDGPFEVVPKTSRTRTAKPAEEA